MKIKSITRIAVIVISVLLIAGYFLPIWDIDLEAPQYPEGLGMQIWINKITGDLQTINGLNHYIGMKTIEPDSIAELKFMPYLLGILIVIGFIAGISRIKWLFYTWVILFVILGIAGGIDFWLWEYDYGHNLDPSAAIQVPGMTYQPPLIGGKELLNFYASSWPALGGWIIIAGGIASVGLFFYELFYNKKRVKKSK